MGHHTVPRGKVPHVHRFALAYCYVSPTHEHFQTITPLIFHFRKFIPEFALLDTLLHNLVSINSGSGDI